MYEMKTDAASSLSLVAENAVALAKAEVHLGLSQAKAQLARLGRVGLTGMLTLLSAQVLLLLVALVPLMMHWGSRLEVASCVGLAALPTVTLSILTGRELRKLKAA